MKIYGITTSIDLEKLEALEEHEVFLMIHKLEIMTTLYENGSYYLKECGISDQDLENALDNLDYLIYYTKKFGVKFKDKPSENRIIKSPSYNKWFNFWYDTYSKNGGMKSFGTDFNKYDGTWCKKRTKRA